jgi:hypothetical protein
LQVTNASERSLELRALASATDASKAWDLRCEIREKMIDFVQQNYPGSLPRVRAEMRADPMRDDPEQKNDPGRNRSLIS